MSELLGFERDERRGSSPVPVLDALHGNVSSDDGGHRKDDGADRKDDADHHKATGTDEAIHAEEARADRVDALKAILNYGETAELDHGRDQDIALCFDGRTLENVGAQDKVESSVAGFIVLGAVVLQDTGWRT